MRALETHIAATHAVLDDLLRSICGREVKFAIYTLAAERDLYTRGLTRPRRQLLQPFISSDDEQASQLAIDWRAAFEPQFACDVVTHPRPGVSATERESRFLLLLANHKRTPNPDELQRLSDLLSKGRYQEQVLWMSLSTSQIHSLRHQLHSQFIDQVFNGSTPNVHNPRDDVTRHFERCLMELLHGLELSHCAIFRPAEHAPELWTIFSEQNFPESLKDVSVYHRGQGLTGAALALRPQESPDDDALFSRKEYIQRIEREHRCILSDHITADNRWSKKLGRTASLTGERPHSFLGVPFYSWAHPATRGERDTSQPKGSSGWDYELPIGAIVCIRKSSARHPYFSAAEIQLVQTVAGLVSFLFDTFIWRQDQCDRRDRFERMSEYWKSSRNESEKFRKTLEVIKRAGGFRRLLLTTLDKASLRIRGKAVIGFDECLVEDTDRTYFPHRPSGLNEDLLSRFIRENEHSTAIVVIEETHELWQCHHTATRLKVNATGRLALIPLISSQNDTAGVILADFADEKRLLSPDVRQEVIMLARMLGDIIERERANAELQRRNDIMRHTMLILEERPGFYRHNENLIEGSLLKEICVRYGYEQGMIFRYVNDDHTLQGFAGYGVNEVVLKGMKLHVENPEDSSFVGHVFRLRQEYFHWDCHDPPVQKCNRERLGIPECSSLIGVPIRLGESVTGVLVLITRAYSDFLRIADFERPRDVIPHEFRYYARFLALLLAIRDWLEELQTSHQQMLEERVILNHLSQIAGMIASDRITQLSECWTKLEVQTELNHLVTTAASLLQSDTCVIVLGEQALRYTADSLRLLESNDQMFFRVCAGHRYDLASSSDREPLGYQFSERSLTMSVLQSLCLQVCPDMYQSPLWSHKMCQASEIDQRLTDHGNATKGTWLGVPIRFRDNTNVAVFGVLSFTRLYNGSNLESRKFTERDIAIAEKIANLLGLALSGIDLRGGSVARLLQWYSHDNRKLIAEVQHAAEELRRLAQDVPQAEQQYRNCMISSSVLDGMFVALANFSGRRANRNQYQQSARLAEVEQDAHCIGTYLMSNAKKGVAFKCTMEDALRSRNAQIDDPSVLYLVYALVQNAIRAVDRDDSEKDPSVSIDLKYLADLDEAELRISGNGEAGDFCRRFNHYCTVGESGFGSTGIGLALCRHIAERHQCILFAEALAGSKGATVGIRIPLVQRN
jgi:GAF domain-containing protein